MNWNSGLYFRFTYSISMCQFFVQHLVLLPQLADGLCILLDGGLRALIICRSVSIWWTHVIVKIIIAEKTSLLTFMTAKYRCCRMWSWVYSANNMKTQTCQLAS